MFDVRRIRQLIKKVPQPPGELLPEGITADECAAFEKRSCILLPPDMREWLQIANGPCVGPGGLFGIGTKRPYLDIEEYFQMYPSWKSKKWIPVAGDGCGNYYVVSTEQEYGTGYPVLFVNTSSSSENPAYIVASDLSHFLVAILEKELGTRGWPFDEIYVTNSDPQITIFKQVAMPWLAI